MLTRYIDCHVTIAKSVAGLYADHVKIKKFEPGVSSTAAELSSWRKCVDVLKSAEEATALLDAEKTNNTHSG